MRLLYFTEDFPLCEREFFPSLEISYLAEVFEEILIVPTMKVVPKDMDPFPLPKNVSYISEIGEELALESRRPGFIRNTIGVTHGSKLLAELLRLGPKHRMAVGPELAKGLALKRIIQRRVDVSRYNVWYSFWCTEAALAMAFLKDAFPKVKTTTRCHGYDLYSERRGLTHLPFQKFTLDRMDGIFPCSQNGRDYLIKKYPDFASKVETQYLGISEPKTLTKPSAEDPLRILSCGALRPVKRTHLIAEALSKVSRQVEWTHLGDGPEKSKIEFSSLHLPNNVIVKLLGNLKNEAVHEYYESQTVDLFLNVSESEGVPVAIMEALAHGIPCFATDVGGASEAIDETCGRLLDRNFQPKDLAELIDHLTREELIPLREGARQRFLSRFKDSTNYSEFSRRIVSL